MYLDDNTEVTSDEEKAVAFSNFFRSIFTDHSSCSLPALATSPLISNSTLENISLSPEEVLQELKCLKTSKSTGPDGLPARILVECAYEIHSSCL